MLCTGRNRNNGPCKRQAVPGTDHCQYHGSAEQYAALKTEALDLLHDQVGTNEVARRTGVSQAQVSRWSTAAGIVPDRAAQTEAAHEGLKLAWATYRGALADRLAQTIDLLLDRIEADDGDPRGNATAVGIFVDKAQVVTGGATSRYELVNAQRRRERIDEMADELAARRAVKDGTTGG